MTNEDNHNFNNSGILIVEDNPLNLRLIVNILKEAGHSVRVAVNGEQALRSVSAKIPELIILDINLPDIPGYQICQRIKSNPKTNHIPVIFVSALQETEDKVKGFDAGGIDYIPKPFAADEVLARVNLHLKTCRLSNELILKNNELTKIKASLEQQVSERTQEVSVILESVGEGIVRINPNGQIISANPACCKLLGYAENEIQRTNFQQLVHHRKIDTEAPLDSNAAFDSALKKGKVQHVAEELFMHKEKNSFQVEYWINPVYQGNDLDGAVVTFHDITERKQNEEAIRYLAYHDALTNLPNRTLLADRLQQSITQAQRQHNNLSVAYLDLDGFKDINNTYGHEVGDKLLVKVASRIQKLLRRGDTIARLGGDEFVIVLTNLKQSENSTSLLERIIKSIAEPIHIKQLTLSVTASIGVTSYPQDNELDADQLIRQADQAMYEAKVSGKNRYSLFDTRYEADVRGVHEILDQIDHGIKYNEFILYYQPKVNMRSGEVIGAEALIRWKHPERGLLPPSEFLPVIEDHPLNIELGEWVINSALKQIQEWKSTGLNNLSVSVNVSALHLQQRNFTERLKTFLENYPEVQPENLKLEVLETSALNDIEQISSIMKQCQVMGIQFSIDDFGTGYSSLTYLRRLPATELKIDRSFVRDMLSDPEDLAILEGILGLATAFRLKVIAEGVESIEHGNLLLKLGCDNAQGYVISAPMAAEQFPNWLNNWQPDHSWSKQQVVSKDDVPLLFSSVEHRAWINALENYLCKNNQTPPPLGLHDCRFSSWLDGVGFERYQQHPLFKEIQQIHQNIHEHANQLVNNMSSEHEKEDIDLTKLKSLRDKLLKLLDNLVENQTEKFISSVI